jgi:membrane fusion protein (multidrug efflux system)
VPLRAGQQVAAGTALVELNADAERAQLQALQAAEDLSRITLKRDREQFSARAVSQATIDADEADLRSRSAQVAQQKALVEKKIIRAPFAGRVGISTVNPGQYLNTGDKVVTLQADDILLADFNLPQREAGRALAGAQVQVEVDALPGTSFTGQVTAVSPAVDAGTRNLMVEARIANPRHQLVPGMFARVGLRVGAAQRFITLPQAAVTFNPYGATVFVVRPAGPEDAKAAAPGAPPGPAPGTPVARQVFITTGLTRGDQVAVLKGLQEGDVVVTSGQLKLKNGAPLKVDNSTPPPNDAQPAPQEQ